MAERGYLEAKAAEIGEEVQRRKAAEEVVKSCERLVEDFSYFNPNFGGTPLDLPTVQWNDDGSELFHVLVKDGDGEDVLEEDIGEPGSVLRYRCVKQAVLQFFPSGGEDMIDVLTIDFHGGPNVTPIVYDYDGRPLALEELEMVSNDLARYRELIEQGKIEPDRIDRAE